MDLRAVNDLRLGDDVFFWKGIFNFFAVSIANLGNVTAGGVFGFFFIFLSPKNAAIECLFGDFARWAGADCRVLAPAITSGAVNHDQLGYACASLITATDTGAGLATQLG